MTDAHEQVGLGSLCLHMLPLLPSRIYCKCGGNSVRDIQNDNYNLGVY